MLVKIKSRGFEMFVTPEYSQGYSNFEPLTSFFALSIYDEKKIFLDIGGHYGYYSTLIGKHKKNSKIIAFEPTKESFSIFKKNIQLNKLDSRVKINNCAISDKNEKIKMYLPEGISGKSSVYKLLTKKYTTQEIVAYPIDQIINDPVSIAKVDAEGHEIPIIKGMRKTIDTNKELSLIVEFHPNNLISAGYKPSELLELIKFLGFEIYFLVDYYWFVSKDFKVSETNAIIFKIDDSDEWKNILSNDGRCNLLCIKKEMSINIYRLLQDLYAPANNQLFFESDSINNEFDKKTAECNFLKNKLSLYMNSFANKYNNLLYTDQK